MDSVAIARINAPNFRRLGITALACIIDRDARIRLRTGSNADLDERWCNAHAMRKSEVKSNYGKNVVRDRPIADSRRPIVICARGMLDVVVDM